MIVIRYTHTAKPGKRNELIDLLKNWIEAGMPGRVLTPGYADWDKVELECEWETEEDRQKFWADYDRSHPKIVEFHEKISDLRESGSTRVRWETQ